MVWDAGAAGMEKANKLQNDSPGSLAPTVLNGPPGTAQRLKKSNFPSQSFASLMSSRTSRLVLTTLLLALSAGVAGASFLGRARPDFVPARPFKPPIDDGPTASNTGALPAAGPVTAEAQQAAQAQFAYPAPTHLGKRLRLWATHYNVFGAHYDPAGYPLLDASGTAMGPKLSRHDWCLGTFEATIKVLDGPGGGQVYNFDSTSGDQQVDCGGLGIDASPKQLQSYERTRFAHSAGPWGTGALEMQLVPYRSIAVDPKVIPYGSLLYIPDAQGLDFTLPSGEKIEHDGYFFAADDGQTVKKNHIDVFTGTYIDDVMTDFIEDSPKKTFSAYIVQDPKILAEMQRQHHWNEDELPD